MWKKIRGHILPFAIAIALPLAVGTLSALLTRNSMNIYDTVKTPPLSPPGIVFPIVWTVLYILMGVSSALVFTYRDRDMNSARAGLSAYLSSLVFNFLWSIIFFNIRSPLAALVTLLVLLYFIIRTVLYYRRVSPVGAALQIPYILWVAFAGYLNGGIFFLN